MDFGSKLRGILYKPTQTFRTLKREHFKDTLVYLAIMSIIPAVLSGIILYAGITAVKIPIGITNPTGYIIGTYIATFVGVLIAGLWYHLWLLVVGYKGNLEETLKAVIYGNTPSYLLSWIPFVGWISYIWSAILVIFGASEYGKTEWWRALIALIIAILIPVFIAVFFVGLALIALIR